jgi:hypothetical protein
MLYYNPPPWRFIPHDAERRPKALCFRDSTINMPQQEGLNPCLYAYLPVGMPDYQSTQPMQMYLGSGRSNYINPSLLRYFLTSFDYIVKYLLSHSFNNEEQPWQLQLIK